MISDGATPPNGLMTNCLTDMVFICDLDIDFGESNSRYAEEAQSVGGAGGMSWGPFHLGGKHTNSNDERTSSAEWSSQGLSIKGMALLGGLYYMLREKSPNPNPNVQNWIETRHGRLQA